MRYWPDIQSLEFISTESCWWGTAAGLGSSCCLSSPQRIGAALIARLSYLCLGLSPWATPECARITLFRTRSSCPSQPFATIVGFFPRGDHQWAASSESSSHRYPLHADWLASPSYYTVLLRSPVPVHKSSPWVALSNYLAHLDPLRDAPCSSWAHFATAISLYSLYRSTISVHRVLPWIFDLESPCFFSNGWSSHWTFAGTYCLLSISPYSSIEPYAKSPIYSFEQHLTAELSRYLSISLRVSASRTQYYQRLIFIAPAYSIG